MTSAVSALYEPLIARDLAAVKPAVHQFRRTHTSDELAMAVGRFAILSYAPSHHAKHAVLAALSALDLRDELGSRWDDLLVQCAIYAAASRQPWSEPPLMDPPRVEAGAPAGVDELRAAITARDRLRAEHWLAARLHDDESLMRDLAAVAAEDPSDMGHKLIITNAARRLASILGEKGRFVTLRMAVWELTAYAGEVIDSEPARDSDALLRKLIVRCVDEGGSLESVHAVFLYDAALDCGVLDRVSGHLDRSAPPSETSRPDLTGDVQQPECLVYNLGRDLGACLKAHAVAKRLRGRFPDAPLDAFVAAAHANLENAASLEEWSFA